MSLSPIPEDVFKEAKNCFLDYLGVSLAGARILSAKTNSIINTYVGKTVVIGTNKTSSPDIAALVNGMYAHVTELDDGERFGMFHPGAPIISALLPITQEKGIAGLDFLRGIIFGYEAAIRLASTLQPSLKDKGFHATGICGAIGAAIGIGIALKFSKQQLKDCLSIAASNASGILKITKDVSELKPYNVGKAAQNGLSAAMLALSGFRGPLDVFGGKLGFLAIFSDKVNLEHLLGGDNKQFAIKKIYRKIYAACRHCHPAIEGAISLRNQFSLNSEDIKSVTIDTYYWAVGGHDHTEIDGINSAKMSIPYSVAVALVTGKAGLNEFTERYITDKKIIDLTKKVAVVVNDELTRLVPHKRGAIIKIETLHGDQISEHIDLPKGEPETSLSDEELIDKFSSLALYSGKTQESAEQIIDIVQNTEARLGAIYSSL